MKTKKVALSELKVIVEQIIKEEVEKYQKTFGFNKLAAINSLIELADTTNYDGEYERKNN
ncbi:MAG: hypothetical protein WC466_06880 [Candidatus Izemoplasmatales bacterium]